MALVSAQNLARSFGADDIFEGVSVSIPHEGRIALVGPNGAGKTTLLRLLAGFDTPTGGVIHRAKTVQVGFLPQRVETELEGKHVLWDEMLIPFADLIRREAELESAAQKMADHPDDTALIEHYGELQSRFENDGGYDYLIRISQVLGGLGFEEEDFQRPISQLSGGQKTRALLARLLLENPDLLILDEPTNHLDIRAIEWLESWLKDFRGGLLIVSHDRYFMDAVVDTVWEMIFGRLETYRGNYSHYVQQREERHTYLLAEYERQQSFIEKEQDYIRRNIAGQNTRQAQGRRKRLDRYLRDQALLKPREHRSMRLNIQTDLRSGDEVIKTRDLVIGYHDDRVPLFTVPDIILRRGECAALIGPNGAGKSTLMKTILGQLKPLEGKVAIGASVRIGYFAQAHEELHDDNSILDEIISISNLPISEARDYLAAYLFTGDDVYKLVSTLSGGERGRVALAKLALSGANVLLLDEPTNHLDIPSQEILENVLDEFSGTILLISHDRYLIRDLATQIWALDGSMKDHSSQLAVYEGPYTDYLAWRGGRAAESPGEAKKQRGNGTKSNKKSSDGLTLYQREKLIEKVESAIHVQEQVMADITAKLETASAAGDVTEVTQLGDAYTEAEATIEKLMAQWETLHNED